ncbi:hypothetical protein CAPTEDRAFT_137191 [Capitella teleta]|uniref:ABC transporter domain-containing protein n=1 Tax=Capitella teleta TaxID=283909 RepID=R7UHT7_CAPTE|nr:hypothetical protein CAPTEDRAFT_137191 [Capitella teleta]|eukprot:ELU06094.1 hypothetical protein CAPTEDRAFT_137191 [Capitella teleta]
MLSGVDLAFKDVHVDINGTQILKNVSGQAKQGDMLAIMGPSGAGKSTLLNCLSCRRPISGGSVTLNGHPMTNKLRRKICYVLQEDILFTNLTCRETLKFTAMLKMPRRMPNDMKQKRVDDIIKILDLEKCQNTRVGDFLNPGLSGGEKKRTSIACELLTNPSLLVLDEPTSGLDSAIAYSLMQVLKTYTQQNKKTVVTTIHQPSSQIFYMFDNILLLCDGQVAYFGKSTRIMTFFNSIGLYSELDYNPADFILDKVKESDETQQKILTASMAMRNTDDWPRELRSLNSSFVSKDEEDEGITITVHSNNIEIDNVPALSYGLEKGITLVSSDAFDIDKYTVEGDKWPSSFWTQYTALLARAFINTKDRVLSKLTIIQTLCLAVILGMMWFNLERSEETYNDRLGVIFFMNAYLAMVPVFEILTSFPGEKKVITKEREAGTYRLSAYYWSKMTSEGPLVFILPTLFLSIAYWMVNLMREADNFIFCWLIMLLAVFTAQSIGLLLGIITPDFKTSITVASITMLAALLGAGFYTKHMPDWISWIQYLSFMHYAFGAMLKIEFRYGNPLKCNPIETTQFASCIISNGTGVIEGEDILQFAKMDNEIWIDIVALFVIFLLCRLSGYIFLRIFQKPGRN